MSDSNNNNNDASSNTNSNSPNKSRKKSIRRHAKLFHLLHNPFNMNPIYTRGDHHVYMHWINHAYTINRANLSTRIQTQLMVALKYCIHSVEIDSIDIVIDTEENGEYIVNMEELQIHELLHKLADSGDPDPIPDYRMVAHLFAYSIHMGKPAYTSCIWRMFHTYIDDLSLVPADNDVEHAMWNGSIHYNHCILLRSLIGKPALLERFVNHKSFHANCKLAFAMEELPFTRTNLAFFLISGGNVDILMYVLPHLTSSELFEKRPLKLVLHFETETAGHNMLMHAISLLGLDSNFAQPVFDQDSILEAIGNDPSFILFNNKFFLRSRAVYDIVLLLIDAVVHKGKKPSDLFHDSKYKAFSIHLLSLYSNSSDLFSYADGQPDIGHFGSLEESQIYYPRVNYTPYDGAHYPNKKLIQRLYAHNDYSKEYFHIYMLVGAQNVSWTYQILKVFFLYKPNLSVKAPKSIAQLLLDEMLRPEAELALTHAVPSGKSIKLIQKPRFNMTDHIQLLEKSTRKRKPFSITNLPEGLQGRILRMLTGNNPTLRNKGRIRNFPISRTYPTSETHKSNHINVYKKLLHAIQNPNPNQEINIRGLPANMQRELVKAMQSHKALQLASTKKKSPK